MNEKTQKNLKILMGFILAGIVWICLFSFEDSRFLLIMYLCNPTNFVVLLGVYLIRQDKLNALKKNEQNQEEKE